VRGSLTVLIVLCGGCTQLLGVEAFTTEGGGSPDASTFDAMPADAGIDAAPAPIRAVAIGNGAPGKLGVLDVRVGTVATDAVPDIVGSDTVMRRIGGEYFVINRTGVNGSQIAVLAGDPLAVTRTYTLPAGSNPQDVAAAGGKLYVPAYSSTGILIIDRDDGDVRTLPLLQAEDPDTHPDCASAYYTGVHVVVACGVLDAAFVPRGAGKVVIVDPFNDTVTSSFDLPFANPYGFLMPTRPDDPAAGELLVATVPSFTNFSTGCLARIGLGATPASNGCLVTNQALGGWANQVEADPTGALLWIASTIYDVNFNPYGRLVAYDLVAGTLGTPISEPGEEIADVAACPGGYVVAADRNATGGGIRIYHDGTVSPVLDLGVRPAPGAGLGCD